MSARARDLVEDRFVQLSPEQLTQLRRVSRDLGKVKAAVQEAIFELIKQDAQSIEDFWDQIAKLAGYKDLIDLQSYGFEIQMEWARGGIAVMKEKTVS